MVRCQASHAKAIKSIITAVAKLERRALALEHAVAKAKLERRIVFRVARQLRRPHAATRDRNAACERGDEVGDGVRRDGAKGPVVQKAR